MIISVQRRWRDHCYGLMQTGRLPLFADLKYDGSERRSVRSIADNLRKLRRIGRHGASPYLKRLPVTGMLDGNAQGMLPGLLPIALMLPPALIRAQVIPECFFSVAAAASTA